MLFLKVLWLDKNSGITQCFAAPSTICGQAVLTAPGSLLALQNPRPHLEPIRSQYSVSLDSDL